MSNLAQLEATFQRYVNDLERWVPDGILDIDLALLQRLDLIHDLDDDEMETHEKLAQYFHVVEAPEKITLFNELFAIWIVPEVHNDQPVTYALVGQFTQEGISLELVLSAAGVYNSSRIMLRVLDRLLADITETNEELNKLNT